MFLSTAGICTWVRIEETALEWTYLCMDVCEKFESSIATADVQCHFLAVRHCIARSDALTSFLWQEVVIDGNQSGGVHVDITCTGIQVVKCTVTRNKESGLKIAGEIKLYQNTILWVLSTSVWSYTRVDVVIYACMSAMTFTPSKAETDS